jgi:uncharacterized SAM-dependent methyltransferase
MHLVSRARQTVHVRALDLEVPLQAGEKIWTESSYKYEEQTVVRMVEGAGFTVRAQWIHDRHRFALTLFEAV